MAAAREKKRQAEDEAEKSRTEKIAGLANIENNIKKKHQQIKGSAARPPASKIKAKVPRTVSTSAMLAVTYQNFPDTMKVPVKDNGEATANQHTPVSHPIFAHLLFDINSP